MMRIVGVHGVGNHRPSATPAQAQAELSTIWRRALARRFPAPVDLKVAYYADHLNLPGRHGTEEDLSPEARELLTAWLALFDVPAGLAHGTATRPIRQALAWIAERRRLAPRLVELVFPMAPIGTTSTSRSSTLLAYSLAPCHGRTTPSPRARTTAVYSSSTAVRITALALTMKPG